ncbi:hypothetical protein EOI86_01195 [Hwanghaeella grinnelliae]|uniref:DUF3313 domain-containing protein n=1 Tax=Hwanghaeella grinnelliae TaxID=2500179 RepID=A0A437QTX2_9PROT|nr:hypothetical protein [Hwanghaeella grinnelliae]RVU37951.1 hypothetical protein EOI86_01195 [Hwanghaeella grinnelliae]
MRIQTLSWRCVLAAVLTTILLSACGPVPQPFRQDANTKARTTLARATITSGIRVLPVAGMQLEQGAALSEVLAEKLRDMGTVATTSDALRNAHFLSPNVINRDGIVLIRWDLFDPDGVQRDTVIAKAPTPAQLNALLTGRTKSLREMIGYVAGRLHKTLNPRSTNPAVERTARLAIGTISGAPGNGAEDLSRAAIAVFSRAGISMANSNDAPDLLLNAEISLSPIDADNDLLTLAWSIDAPDGRQVGRLVQESAIQKGTLDGPWRGLAYDAILGLVDSLQEVQEAYKQGA